MTLRNEEVITVAAADAFKAPTEALVDNSPGGPRATLAVITNHDLGDSGVAFRIGDTPVSDTYLFQPLAPGDVTQVSGYENIRDLRFLLTGSVTAKLYVQYFA